MEFGKVVEFASYSSMGYEFLKTEDKIIKFTKILREEISPDSGPYRLMEDESGFCHIFYRRSFNEEEWEKIVIGCQVKLSITKLTAHISVV